MARSAPSRRPAGTRAAETAARRRRLLVAATDLAAEGGYDAVQMRDVAARAEVALGTLYRHYSSKDQLLVAALAAQAEALRDRLTQRPAVGDTPAGRVENVLRRACRSLEREPRVTAAMVTALASTEPSAAEAKQGVYDAFTEMVSRAVDGDDVADLDGILSVLGHVWFSAMAFWVGGLSDGAQMADDLARAAHLLLDA